MHKAELLSEIVVEALGPEEALEGEAHMISEWDSTTCDFFVGDDNSGVEDYYGDDTDSVARTTTQKNRRANYTGSLCFMEEAELTLTGS